MCARKVLVVDDSSITRETVRIILEALEFIVLEASNGREALTKLSSEGAYNTWGRPPKSSRISPIGTHNR